MMPNFHQIVRLHLSEQLAQVPLLPALHRRIEADGTPVRPGLDDLIQTVESAAADKRMLVVSTGIISC